jgi:SAM-dependent methyltransferase
MLAQRLMRIGEEAMAQDRDHGRLSPSAALVLYDIIEHQGTSITEIAERTGLPQDHVSASASRLADDNFLRNVADSPDGPHFAVRGQSFQEFAGRPVDEELTAALGGEDAAGARELLAALESVGRRLSFNAAYAGTPSWDIGRPQPALAEAAESRAIRGRVLDVGCGTGEHALMAAEIGLSALGVDLSSAAIEIARRKARERSLTVRFAVKDALDLKALGEQFDTVLDSGLFHCLSDEDRVCYASSLGDVIPPGGRLFILCVSSDHQNPNVRPSGPQHLRRRITPDEITSTFATGWRVDAIDPAKIYTNARPDGMAAWRATVTRC